MKTVSGTLSDKIRYDHHNVLKLVVEAEWKFNRFAKPVAENTPNEDENGYDIELFPIESIIKPNRPKSGINKAVVGQALTSPEVQTVVPTRRYYLCSAEDQYKYWQSPNIAGASAPYTIANCAPQVLYFEQGAGDTAGAAKIVQANKIHFTVENSYATPTAYTVQTKASAAASWTTVSTTPSVPSNGLVELWWNGTSWTTTKNLTGGTRPIHGVRLVVTQMNKSAYFNLIELGAALELDLSSDAISASRNANMGEVDFITPLGTISANTGSVLLMNETRRYSNENASSDLFGLIDKNVKITAFYQYDSERVQEFEMYSDIWQDSEEEGTVSISVNDNTKLFQETKPKSVLYQKIPVQEAVWRICDMIGFTDYKITTVDTEPHAIIDIFWTDGQKTAWEIFSELSRATQTAIFFDSYGKLNVMTRGAAWDSTKSASYNFIRNSIPGVQPANIINFEDETSYEANKAIINYKPAGFSEQIDNITPFEVVWQPEGNTVLRASRLVKDLLPADAYVRFSATEGKSWPYKGIMQIRGEWIKYEGKQYKWFDESNVAHWTDVKSLAEQQKLDARTGQFYRQRNGYNGALKITERGAFNTADDTDTDAMTHKVALQLSASQWVRTRRVNYTTNNSPCAGIKNSPGTSTLTIEQVNSQANDITYLHRGNNVDTGYYRIGTRMRIDSGSHAHKTAGIFFSSDGLAGSPSSTALGTGAGYYIEIQPTFKFTGKKRQTQNEIMFYSMKSNGDRRYFGGKELKKLYQTTEGKNGVDIEIDGVGGRAAIVQNAWFDLDVKITPGSSDRIDIYINGKPLFFAVVPAGEWKHTWCGRFGMYVKGNSKATWEYIYAGSNSFGINTPEDSSYYDRILGGYYSNQWQRDFAADQRTVRRKVRKKWKKYVQRYNQRFYDEFGPIAHEIREFDVKFTSERPSLQSKVYSSNTTQALVTDFWADPMNAHFKIHNISRRNAVINGEDTLTTNGNGSVNHKLFVYGRPVLQKDAAKVEKTDEASLRRRGAIEIEYESDWIQNEAEAESLGEWLTTHWASSDSNATMEVFGNPMIELADVVHVEYLDVDDDFYVVGIENTFDQGLSTKLTLRKV